MADTREITLPGHSVLLTESTHPSQTIEIPQGPEMASTPASSVGRTKSKKGKASSKEPQRYAIDDVVLGKMKGYPPWPGVIFDPEKLPPAVKADRVGGGIRYPVQFFPAGDYAWMDPKCISKLKKNEIEGFLRDNKGKRRPDLVRGYEIALNPAGFDPKQALATMSDGDAQSEEEEEEKPKKRKRDSTGVSGASKGKKRTKKSKEQVESEEDDADADADPEMEVPATSVSSAKKGRKNAEAEKEKEKKDDKDNGDVERDPEALKVREWRHKLQKVFLSSKGPPPRDEDMPAMDELLKVVEMYPNMTFSKIGKVMRHVAGLEVEKVPRDVEFSFRERAKRLVDRWHLVTNPSDANGTMIGGGPNGDLSLGKQDTIENVAAMNGNGFSALTLGDGDVSMAGI